MYKTNEPIIVVYDGKAPRETAKNLSQYIASLGYTVKLVDEDDFVEGYTGKVITVGHHDFTKDRMEFTGKQYDSYGMSYGHVGNVCVLTASRSALGSGEKGRKRFAEYYNKKMQDHWELANRYGIPLVFGGRHETRESQYDLLWLEFVTRDLSDFLEATKTIHESIPTIRGKAAANQLKFVATVAIKYGILKPAMKQEALLVHVFNKILPQKDVPVRIDDLKFEKTQKNEYVVYATVTVLDYASLMEMVVPKVMHKLEGKKIYTILSQSYDIIRSEKNDLLDLISDEKKANIIAIAVEQYEEKICRVLSKKAKVLTFHSFKVMK